MGRNRVQAERREAAFFTPWGPGAVTVVGDLLVEVYLPVPAGPLSPWPAGGGASVRGAEDAAVPPFVAPASPFAAPAKDRDLTAGENGDPLYRWAAALESYFTAGPRDWTAEELRLDEQGFGEFARTVYEALLRVPVGETVSYGELAVLAGYPGAARAVGTAMAQNPLPIVIPCHRVLRSDGSMGRYGDCDALKPYLLSYEEAL